MSSDEIIRVRVSYQKLGSLRYVGHIDLHSLLERALRRSGLPLRFSQGFRPKVRLNLASALPLGIEGLAELFDFWLRETREATEIRGVLSKALPAELPVLGVHLVPNILPSLQADLRAAVYEVQVPPEDGPRLREALANAMKQDEVIVTRREKTLDMRPWIEAFQWLGPNAFKVRLRAMPQASGRPDELLAYLGFDPAKAAISRTELIFATEDSHGN